MGSVRTLVPKRGPVGRQAAARDAVVKASTFRPRSSAEAPPDEQDPAWQGVGFLEPPYPPSTLLEMFEQSNSLRPCTDAYVTNIEAFGHRFKPVIDLTAADADKLVRQYIIARRAVDNPTIVANPNRQIEGPKDEEVTLKKEELAERMAAEGMRVQQFFTNACLDYSFTELRRRTRQDLEVQGNGYWECIRDAAGQLAAFEYLPAFTIRHMPLSKKPVAVTYRVKENLLDYGTVNTVKRFRRFVQVFESTVTYFKEFGDPRVLSRKSGYFYDTIEDLRKEEGKRAAPASEILHFRVHTSKSSYGIPRWIGAMLSVLGSRHSEEVNLTYFENKSVPPLAILVSGGRISNDTVTRIQDFIENDIKGKRNFHKVLVIEAESPGGTGFDQGRMKVEMKPLTSAMNADALFQNYDERNIDKVGQSFRLPRMVRGDIRDFNRATADAALIFTEAQVFKPERDEFDFTINRKVMPAIDVAFWEFASNSCTTTNAKELGDLVTAAGEVGFITPAEGRDLLEGVFNRPFRKIEAPWVRQPLALTVAGIVPPDDLMSPGMVSPQQAATGATVVAPGSPGAPGQATTGGGQSLSVGGGANAAGLRLTGTAAASVITVNEARADAGKGPLMKPPVNGVQEEDPDGYLTVAEFQAKRMSLGQTEGAIEGGGDPNAPPAQGGRPAGKSATMADTIMQLLQIHKASEMLEKLQASGDLDRIIAANRGTIEHATD